MITKTSDWFKNQPISMKLWHDMAYSDVLKFKPLSCIKNSVEDDWLIHMPHFFQSRQFSATEETTASDFSNYMINIFQCE